MKNLFVMMVVTLFLISSIPAIGAPVTAPPVTVTIDNTSSIKRWSGFLFFLVNYQATSMFRSLGLKLHPRKNIVFPEILGQRHILFTVVDRNQQESPVDCICSDYLIDQKTHTDFYSANLTACSFSEPQFQNNFLRAMARQNSRGKPLAEGYFELKGNQLRLMN